MLLQTNSYIVPKDKRTEHARLVKRFRTVMARLGCDDFEVYEQGGPNWSTEVGGRFVQIMRFRDRDHQRAIKTAEQADAGAQDLVREFCELVNFGYQHQQGLATTAYYVGMGGAPAGPATKQLPGMVDDTPAGPASTLNGKGVHAAADRIDEDEEPLDLSLEPPHRIPPARHSTAGGDD